MENSTAVSCSLSVLLQFAKFSKGFRIGDFEEFVKEYIGFEKLDFFGRLAYPNQWQIRLTDPDLRESLIRDGRTRINNRSCWMYPLNQQEIRGFVHWLPNSVTNDQLKEQLKLYGEVLFVKSQERSIRGRKIESDHRYYGLILPHGTIKEDLPHFLKINGFLCLVVVRGREPACYHCKEVGHRRAECPKYKAKLISYCNREPSTAPPRLRPRGRRHVKAQTEVRPETGGNEVSSSDDIVSLEQVSVAELITEPDLLDSEDRGHVIEARSEATDSTEKELVKSGILVQRKAKSCVDSSAASFSETKTSGVLEIIRQIQRKTTENLQENFKYLEKGITLAITRGSHSTRTEDQRQSMGTDTTYKNFEVEMENVNLEMQAEEVYAPKESTTPFEMAENYSNADMDIKELKATEISSDIPTMHKVTKADIENFFKKSKENPQFLQSTDSAANDSTRNVDTISPVLLMLKETKQAASETFEKTFKKLGEFAMSIKVPEEPSKTSTEMVPKFTEKDGQELLNMLKNLKANTTEYSSFKKIEANLQSQLSGESIDTEAKLSDEDRCFAKQMFEKTKENTSIILKNTIQNLEEEVMKVTGRSQTATEGATESEANPKIANIATQTDTTLEQPKQDTVVHICMKNIEATKEKAIEIFQNTIKNLEVDVVKVTGQSETATESTTESEGTPKIANIATQPIISEQPKGNIIDIVMHRCQKKLEVPKENTTGIVQSTFKEQDEKVVKVAKPSETAIERATESKQTPTTENIATTPDTTLKQNIDVLKPICIEGVKVIETENIEIASRHGKSPEETFQIESDPVTIVQREFEATGISEENRNVRTGEKAFSERKGLDSNISKAIQEDIDNLQTNIKKIFASVQDKTQLLPETTAILKQVESEVVKVVEETKNRWIKEY